MSRKEFSLQELTKVEGHAKLNVEMEGDTVKQARLDVFEPSRYFESMVLGKYFDIVPTISQRICGICSVIHTITSIKAVEDAMGVTPSTQTVDLRSLMLYASTIHSHTAHLFFFAAPDYLGLDDVMQMAREKREHLRLAIELQRLSAGAVKTIGGRSLHPVTPRVGGFHSVPGKAKISGLMIDFKRIRKLCEEAAKVFMSFKYPAFENKTQHVAMFGKVSYPFYDGDMTALGKRSFKVKDYKRNIQEQVVPNSTAKYSKLDGAPYMTGSLARLNINHKNLSRTAASFLRRSKIKPPCFNPFLNNVAQAIELVHCSDMAIRILEKYAAHGMREERTKIRPKAGEGIAACEAPRGALYHHYRFNAQGKATYANIITPTCQNIRNMESDMQKLMPGIIRQPDKRILRTLEMLVRAYDPCFSCSTHFLDLSIKRQFSKHKIRD